MLTAQRLFTGKTVSHVLAKVLDRDVDFAALPDAHAGAFAGGCSADAWNASQSGG